VRLVLICVGKIKPPFADDVAHYVKLLGPHARLDMIEVGEEEAVLKRIPAGSHVIALDRGGEELTSEELAAFIADRRLARADLCFLIGGPHGLDPAVLEHSQRCLALGRITLPHQLARVVFLEQLFRAHKILAGEPYHY
jgi:23S rRNA (pseudouridine1915-N3)-methyltransferase